MGCQEVCAWWSQADLDVNPVLPLTKVYLAFRHRSIFSDYLEYCVEKTVRQTPGLISKKGHN